MALFRVCALLPSGNPHKKGLLMTSRLILAATAITLGAGVALAGPPTSTPGGATPATPATSATPATPADPSTGASAKPATPADPATPAEPAAKGTDTTDATATTDAAAGADTTKQRKHKKK
jgi:hypothetical protein